MASSNNSVNGSSINEPLTIITEALKTPDIPPEFRMEGWVYILSNEYMPDVYKVGMTTLSPEERASQISQGTGIPFPFKVYSAYYSDDPRSHEAEIHEYLSRYRISNNREFFHCPIETIEDAFSGAGLIERQTPLEVIADNYDVICLEKSDQLYLSELFDELNIRVFGCKQAAVKRLVELASENIKKLNRKGCSLLLQDAKATPIISYTSQMMKEHERLLNEAGAYGPRKPWSF